MLPTPGRGRGRGKRRNSREISAPGRQLNSVEQELFKEIVPSYSDRNAVMQAEFQSSGNCSIKTPYEIRTQQQKVSEAENKNKKQISVNPEEIFFQLKRKLTIRPNEGSLGKRIKLISNCFSIKVPSGIIFHYDVSIIKIQRNPGSEDNFALFATGMSHNDKKYRCLSTKRNREIIKLLLNTNPIFENSFAAYDGQKNLYTRNPLHADFPIKCKIVLPNENGNLHDPHGNNQDAYEVEIKPVIKKETESCTISLDSIHALFEQRTTSVSQEAIMALETILRHGPTLQFTPIGRSFFYPPNPENMHPLGGGLEIWFGHHQSIRLGQWGPMVNLDFTATTFFQKGPVVSYIAELMNTTVGELRRRPYLPNIDVRKISNKLKNRRIEVTHLRNYRRKYRILKLVKENANHLEFELKENGRTVKKTVAAYFRERYNRILEFPNLPCLLVHPENKKTYLPIEVCEFVEGQHSTMTLDGKQKSEMIKFTALSPKDRFSEIQEIRNRVSMNNDGVIQQFGLEVSQEPLSLEGRVLESPSIRYKDGQTIKPKDGSWNMQQIQFLSGATIESWIILSLTKLGFSTIKKFADNLVEVAKKMGISINHPQFHPDIDISKCDLKGLFSNMKIKYKVDLAVIILPKNDKFLYGRIKQAAETVVGLVTQCIKENNVTHSKPQLLTNLCQKINTKMGGENNSLTPGETPAILRRPVIIIGADVNHPGASKTLKPSLAACVGSLDTKLSRYAVSMRAQDNIDEKKQAVEIICDLKNMVRDLLRAFYHHTKGKKPEKIVFYRDGVSEGQFEKVREHEVKSIREACRSLQEDYEPGITFIVVQKRHHVRFRPQDQRDGVGSMKNVPPGTVADTVVTHPVNLNFYLCSHLGLKGTSRPAHYTVLEDDNDFSANDLQKLSYQLCHTYARCTRSISIPVPVAYADLAAYRARQHLEAGLEDSTTSSKSSESDFSASDVQSSLSQSVTEAIKVIKGLENAMYFV